MTRHAPVERPEDLPPKQREAWEAVTIYQRENPGVSDWAAAQATGVLFANFRWARDRLQKWADGVASDGEAFEFEDEAAARFEEDDAC